MTRRIGTSWLYETSRKTLWLCWLFILSIPTLAQASGSQPAGGAGAHGACPTTVSAEHQAGVLVPVKQPNFPCYISALLDNVMPYVLTLAMMMIVFSGVQYMLSGVSTENQKGAKQRIIGILSGIVFYFAIRFILRQITDSITLQ